MRRGWLAPFTRADGRALTRALAVFLFLATFVSGLHAGLAAAPGAYAAALCHVAPDGSPPAPAADHEHDCCLPGAAPAALPLPVATGSAPVAASVFAAAPEGHIAASHGALTRTGPRAPPFLPA